MTTKIEMTQDLVKIYSELYELKKKQEICNDEIYPKINNILDCVKYTPKEIEAILIKKRVNNSSNSSHISHDKNAHRVNSVIMNIKTEEQVREYYNNVLSKYYNPMHSEEEKTKILKSITLSDLTHLISVISNVRIPKGRKKPELLYIIRRYFDSVSRTEAMK